MKLRKKFLPGILMAASLLLLIAILLCIETYRGRYTPYTGSHPTILAFAREHGLKPGDWPEDLVGLLDSSPEAEDFVLNYPLEHSKTHTIDLSGLLDSESVPLLLQWDKRWGYARYGDGLIGQTGCGPTCLSMVCLYLLQDASLDPGTLAEFSRRNGYCVPGNGSSWTLISEGGKSLGLDVEEIPLVESIITKNLEAGNPIICVMGPGDFTSSGHYIVLVGYENGLLRVNDPNSPLRSQMLWDFDDIQDQFRNLWVCKAP
mgnify:CR=1 FL=1